MLLDTAGKIIHLDLRERDAICEDPPEGLQEGLVGSYVCTAGTFQWKHMSCARLGSSRESDGSTDFVASKVEMILAPTADLLALPRGLCRGTKTWLHLPGGAGRASASESRR